ncbi:hypothetical protein TNCT_713591 [Trichonephila clavata]|uniref:Uncharacterized protein n=1 Tax=Trichonephila clavata TaxID=2740835 RepID=A0A8X6GXF3_TRICU|nr:hypothetical protein TNCT_713591 [Trichonephila clavata]
MASNKTAFPQNLLFVSAPAPFLRGLLSHVVENHFKSFRRAIGDPNLCSRWERRNSEVGNLFLRAFFKNEFLFTLRHIESNSGKFCLQILS